MKYVDLHSHILPGIDDGAKDIETSIEMVKQCNEQNIGTVVCTPHYYKNSTGPTVDVFLQNRQKSFLELKTELEKRNIASPKFIMGAEVHFDCDLSEIQDIQKLAIEGTKYILIEMPNLSWENWLFDYLYNLIIDKGLIPIIAHIERCHQSSMNLAKLQRLDVYFQINASALLTNEDSKYVKTLLKENKIHFIASDAHNVTSRPNKLAQAMSVLNEKYSSAYGDVLMENAYNMLENKEIEKISVYDTGDFKVPFWKRFF